MSATPDRCKFCGAWVSAVDPGDEDADVDKCDPCAELWGDIARAAVQGFASNPVALTGQFVADRAHDCADAFLRRVHVRPDPQDEADADRGILPVDLREVGDG